MALIFDMDDALAGFLQPITLRKIVSTTVDFVKTETITDTIIDAVVQPAQLETLNKDKIDYGLDYQRVDTKAEITTEDQIVYKNRKYKWFQRGRYDDYGFYSAVFEEIK